MSDHYYSRTPGVAHDRHIRQATLRGFAFRFVTDAGVFSKSNVDFGSRLLIETMDVPLDAEVLDVGCGYGPIGLAAARLAPKGRVTMIDINERAVELAKENAALNGISNVDIRQSDLFEAVRGRSFDVVLTNPPIRAGKSIVHRIFEEGWTLLVPGGAMWVVIQKKQGAPSAQAKLTEVFGNADLIARDKGYWILKAVKR
ncbi:ribosomal RNA small subunit methyltransferase [Paenibacillus sp. 32O-W]|uniref:class I SAM-dependent methyltransferase n=1 Tax=Paenibacillus sp. 32O-W TaxID=1695218 RepID=UPI000722E9B0|nr:class I SAM-dependent methyltransferase [Paenibacillus sp. 32O-W]ALS26165.1 ribosomal RNA small subunit methyltransferase [Paenibacillus sp. 32O-W]